jgi:O-methyltransferase involved in polyketide biosynthesis
MDDLLRERLADNPDTWVVLVGAGLDSRAYRLQGGYWVEIDEVQIIDYKNICVPIEECSNPLQRIAIDFSGERLRDRLPMISAGQSVVVVMEGVFVYLTEAQIAQTLEDLCAAYPGHTLICDLSTRLFIEIYASQLRKKLLQMGAAFRFFSDTPTQIFEQAGYRVVATISVVVRMLELSRAKFARFVVACFMPSLADGYVVHVLNAPRLQ